MSMTPEQMLVEMGLGPLWELREPYKSQFEQGLPLTGKQPEAVTSPPPLASIAAAPAPTNSVLPVPPLAASIPLAKTEPPKTIAPPLELTPDLPVTVDHLDWPEMQVQVAACRACVLCEKRQQAVLGVGDQQAQWLVIGEGPGADEDARGEPFVGAAGKLLDNMLAALDMQRGRNVYIANAVKCRPPNNRTPEATEIAACRPWLERQIELIQPKVILLLGKVAVHSLLKQDQPLGTLRGKTFSYQGIPVVVTYHPAYLLRNLPDKAKAWEDLLFARRTLRTALQNA